jgi:hypothetical protein
MSSGDDDRGLKHLARMSQGLIDTALADGGNVDQLLLGIEKNHAKHFTIEKAHFDTEVGDGLRTADCDRLSLLS